jgi:hypothetical protein
MARAPENKLKGWLAYAGMGVGLVLFITLGTSYAPTLTDFIFHWLIFGIVSAIVFGYQLHDFWNQRRRPVFWLSLTVLFLCHCEFWTRYVFHTYGDHPGLFTLLFIVFIEYVVVAIVVRLAIPSKTKRQSAMYSE